MWQGGSGITQIRGSLAKLWADLGLQRAWLSWALVTSEWDKTEPLLGMQALCGGRVALGAVVPSVPLLLPPEASLGGGSVFCFPGTGPCSGPLGRWPCCDTQLGWLRQQGCLYSQAGQTALLAQTCSSPLQSQLCLFHHCPKLQVGRA